jgi:hypothetical protein
MYQTCTKCLKELPLAHFRIRRDRKKTHRSSCKSCDEFQRITASRTKEGVVRSIYARQKKAKERGIAPPDYSYDDLASWVFSQPTFTKLFNEWVESGYLREMKPSVDRLDDYQGYTLTNIQLLTFRANHLKGSDHVKTGKNRKALVPILQFDLEGNFLKEYFSIAEANRVLGKPQHSSCIVAAAKGKQKTAFGFIWKYVHD